MPRGGGKLLLASVGEASNKSLWPRGLAHLTKDLMSERCIVECLDDRLYHARSRDEAVRDDEGPLKVELLEHRRQGDARPGAKEQALTTSAHAQGRGVRLVWVCGDART